MLLACRYVSYLFGSGLSGIALEEFICRPTTQHVSDALLRGSRGSDWLGCAASYRWPWRPPPECMKQSLEGECISTSLSLTEQRHTHTTKVIRQSSPTILYKLRRKPASTSHNRQLLSIFHCLLEILLEQTTAMLLTNLNRELQLLVYQHLHTIDDAHHLARTCKILNAVFEANRHIIFQPVIVSSASTRLAGFIFLSICLPWAAASTCPCFWY